jgi:hypothetical protein
VIGRDQGRSSALLRIPVVATVTALTFAALSAGPRAATATTSPYPPSPVITGITFDYSGYVRRAPGSDNWALTWSNDDHQYTSWGDGGGFSGTNDDCRVPLGFARVEGPATGFVGHDLWGDPRCADHPAQFDGKSLAILSVDGTLYMWRTPGSDDTGLQWMRLYRSTDRAVTWVDTGVQWTYEDHRISYFAFVQFGRDHQEAPDGYVYLYAVHLHVVHFGPQKPGLVYLMRVPKTQLASQSAYQFFSGYGSGGAPLWGNFDARLPVLTDPNGVQRISAMYNPGLNRYLLVTNHTQANVGDMAIFDAPEPWGPWTTVTHETGWPAGGELVRSSYYWNFSPKWLSADGKDFVLVFTGRDSLDAWNSVPGRFIVSSDPLQRGLGRHDRGRLGKRAPRDSRERDGVGDRNVRHRAAIRRGGRPRPRPGFGNLERSRPRDRLLARGLGAIRRASRHGRIPKSATAPEGLLGKRTLLPVGPDDHGAARRVDPSEIRRERLHGRGNAPAPGGIVGPRGRDQAGRDPAHLSERIPGRLRSNGASRDAGRGRGSALSR